MGGTEGILRSELLHAAGSAQRSEAKGFSLALPFSNYFTAKLQRHGGGGGGCMEKKEKVIKAIWQGYKKHFELPGSISTLSPRHSQGQRTWPGPRGGTVK